MNLRGHWNAFGALFVALTLPLLACTGCIVKPPSYVDAGVDSGVRDGGSRDGGHDAGNEVDAGDAGMDVDAGDAGDTDGGDVDAGDGGQPDACVDCSVDAGDGGNQTTDGGNDGGTDGGDGGVDGGPLCEPFSVPLPADAGFINFATQGELCDPGAHQGFCTDGECVTIPGGNMGICSRLHCSDGPGCNGNPDVTASYCVPGFPSICLNRCGANHPCPGLTVCMENRVCVPDCRYEAPTFCTIEFGANQTCDRQTGLCSKAVCATSNDCESNETCDTSLHACVPDCRQIPNYCCNLGQTCNASNGRCSPGAPYSVDAIKPNILGVPEIDPIDAGYDAGPDAGPPDDAGCIDVSCMGDGGWIPSPDAGQCETYVGPTRPDAGTVPGGALGSVCGGGTTNASFQGTCASGLKCLNLTATNTNICVQVGCTQGGCGNNNGIPNICIDPRQGIGNVCVVACDTSHPCPSGTNTVCQNVPGATICLPDCRTQWDNYCSFLTPDGEIHATCNRSNGKCETFSCAAASCPADMVCDSATQQCTMDCRAENLQYCCSLGFARICDPSGVCVKPPMP